MLSVLLARRRCIYSGSWDYSVRVWSRSRLTETALLSYDDWCAAAHTWQSFLQRADKCCEGPAAVSSVKSVCIRRIHPRVQIG